MTTQLSKKRRAEPSATFRQFDCVKTLVSKSEAGIKKGAKGTIMDIYTGNNLPTGYDVSFSNSALETFYAHELKPMNFGHKRRL